MPHSCHNPNCGRPCPAHLVAHASAWFALPRRIRLAIWNNYRAGQEDDKLPTQKYLDALDDAINFWKMKGTQCRIEKRPVSRKRIHDIAQGKF